MDDELLFKLKKQFRKTFPEYADQLEQAKTQDQIDKIHGKIIEESHQNLVKAMNEVGTHNDKVKNVSGGNVPSVPAMMLTNDMYVQLITAQHGDIKNKIHSLIDGLQRLHTLKGTADKGLLIASLILTGIVVFNLLGYVGIAEMLRMRVYTRLGGLLFGSFTTEEAIVFISRVNIAILAIFAVLLPILHFTDKAANCIVVLINETDKPLYLTSDHNVHGHVNGQTTEFPAAVTSPDGTLFPSAGFMVSVKTKGALVGTQYGFTLRYSDPSDSKHVSGIGFGVECPLTRLYQQNNCFCSFDETAHDISKKTNKENKQVSRATKGDLSLTIKCNSKSGSTAYYIARVYPTQK